MRDSIWPTVTVFAGFALAAMAPQAFGAGVVGQPAPALAVETLDGRQFDLASLRGSVIVINFWATWCPPCREEMPYLDAVYRKYRDQGLNMLGMSADRPRDRKRVLKVMEAFGYPAAMLGDAKVNGFGAPGILPVTYVVDAAGVLREVLTGADDKPLTVEQLLDAVVPLLPSNVGSRASGEHEKALGTTGSQASH